MKRRLNMDWNRSYYHYQPTRLHFGPDKLNELGTIAHFYGSKCLLVTPIENEAMSVLFDRVKSILGESGIEVYSFQKVTPNPTMMLVDQAIQCAHDNHVDMVVAVGGGSAIDTAKIVSYCAAIGHADWNALMIKQSPFNFTESNAQALPLIVVPTTSGTGSQVTQCAVISHAENNLKHGIHRKEFFPKEAIIDPKLMQTLPYFLTASTAFDAFCHLSESKMKHVLSPIDDGLTEKALQLIIDTLPTMKEKPTLDGRCALALADTMAGICLANGGGGMPHHLGEMITSAIPRINHGQSLAITFPAFVKVFFDDARYHDFLIELVHLMNPCIQQNSSCDEVLKSLVEFMDAIELHLKISDFDPSEDELEMLNQFIQSDVHSGVLMAMLMECRV